MAVVHSKKKASDSLPPFNRRKRARPKGWLSWPKQSLRDWHRRPKYMREPRIEIHGGFHVCVDCETPKVVKDFCDGTMEVVRETCRYHRALPDPHLTAARNHPEQPIFYPKMDPTRTYHTGRCIIANDYRVLPAGNVFRSIYFRRCTGIYQNALGDEWLGLRSSPESESGSKPSPVATIQGERLYQASTPSRSGFA